jgi:NADPH-dependent curcumin reductase CurA
MSIARHREIRLTASIRTGESVRRGHFDLVETVIPDPGPGQVLVRNRWMAVTAAMRTLMGDVPVPLPMYRAGEVMHGSALGEVVRSDAPALAPGDWVVHGSGWREFAAGEAAAMRRIDPVTTAEQAALHLGQGLTAYVGLRAAAPVRPGDTVFVSGAGGAIGSIAGQLGRLLGAARSPT